MTISPAVNALFWGIIGAVIVFGRLMPFFERRWQALHVMQVIVWVGLLSWVGVHEYAQRRSTRIAILALLFLAMIIGAFIWWIVRSSNATAKTGGPAR